MAPDSAMFGSLPRSPRVADLVIDAIVAKIVTGELRPGDRLPSEAHLAESLDVSIPSVREGLAVLENLNLVATRHGSGRRVNGLSFAALTDRRLGPAIITGEMLLQLYELRMPLEVAIARAAALRATVADIEAMQLAISTMEDAVTKGLSGVEEDGQFHQFVAAASRNQLLELTYSALQPMIREARTIGLAEPGRVDRVLEEHRRISDAIAARDPESAEAAVRQHIRPLGDDAVRRMGEDRSVQ